jgi:hypothetical protein
VSRKASNVEEKMCQINDAVLCEYAALCTIDSSRSKRRVVPQKGKIAKGSRSVMVTLRKKLIMRIIGKGVGIQVGS